LSRSCAWQLSFFISDFKQALKPKPEPFRPFLTAFLFFELLLVSLKEGTALSAASRGLERIAVIFL
jgi:hypothetical protein